MKVQNYIKVLLSVALIFSLTACGVPAQEYQSLSQANVQLEQEVSSLQEDAKQFQERLDEADRTASRLTQDHAQQEKENQQLLQQNESLRSELDDLEAELTVKHQAEAQPVIDSIAAIGEVTLEKEEAVAAARQAYQSLPEKVQKQVNNAQTLRDAETALQQQKDRQAEQERAAQQAEQERIAQQQAEQERAASQAAVEASQQEQESGGNEVLVTPTGAKYHRYKCGNGTYTWTSLANAKARGLTACKKCY